MLVKCLYCDAANDGLSTGAYCESCGKKLPTMAMMKPRRTLGGDLPGEAGERTPLPARSKAASEALFATAIVYLFAGGAFFILAPLVYGGVAPRVFERLKDQAYGPTVLAWTLLPALLVGLLAVLARWLPTPAVAIATLLALAWVVVTFLLHPPLAVGWLAVDAVLLAMLGWSLLRGVQREPARWMNDDSEVPQMTEPRDKFSDDYDRPRRREDDRDPYDDGLDVRRRDVPRRADGAYDEDYPDVRRRGVRGEEYKKAAQQVAGYLFGIAILSLICNLIVIFAMPRAAGMGGNPGGVELAVMLVFVVGIVAFFAGMGTWALWMPVPAGIVGLIAYIGLCLLDVIAVIGAGGGNPLAGIVIKVLLIIGLIRSIAAAAKAS